MSYNEQKISALSKIHTRTNVAALKILTNPAKIEDAIFQHLVLCQTFLPYRNPGDARIWQHKQGKVSLAIQANEAINPHTGNFEFIGLPYGTKSGLILVGCETSYVIK